MKHRIFRIQDESFDKLYESLAARREAARQALIEFSNKMNAVDIRVWPSGRFAGLVFEDAPDKSLWREVRNEIWAPKKNLKAGKVIWKLIDALPIREEIDTLLTEFDLPINGPVLLEGRMGYRPYLTGFPTKGIWFAHVPWREVTKEERDEYENNPDSWSYEFEYLKWTPPAIFKEVKEWEYLKEFEELQAYIDSESSTTTVELADT